MIYKGFCKEPKHMRKIFILGIVASGKTTLQKKLSKKRIYHGMSWRVLFIIRQQREDLNVHRMSRLRLLRILIERDNGFLKVQIENLMNVYSIWRIKMSTILKKLPSK